MGATIYPNLVVLKAESAEALHAQIRQINAPYEIVSLYADEGVHYAWVSSKKKIRLKQENNHGSS
jgi:hypothetical protein